MNIKDANTARTTITTKILLIFILRKITYFVIFARSSQEAKMCLYLITKKITLSTALNFMKYAWNVEFHLQIKTNSTFIIKENITNLIHLFLSFQDLLKKMKKRKKNDICLSTKDETYSIKITFLRLLNKQSKKASTKLFIFPSPSKRKRKSSQSNLFQVLKLIELKKWSRQLKNQDLKNGRK